MKKETQLFYSEEYLYLMLEVFLFLKRKINGSVHPFDSTIYFLKPAGWSALDTAISLLNITEKFGIEITCKKINEDIYTHESGNDVWNKLVDIFEKYKKTDDEVYQKIISGKFNFNDLEKKYAEYEKKKDLFNLIAFSIDVNNQNLNKLSDHLKLYLNDFRDDLLSTVTTNIFTFEKHKEYLNPRLYNFINDFSGVLNLNEADDYKHGIMFLHYIATLHFLKLLEIKFISQQDTFYNILVEKRSGLSDYLKERADSSDLQKKEPVHKIVLVEPKKNGGVYHIYVNDNICDSRSVNRGASWLKCLIEIDTNGDAVFNKSIFDYLNTNKKHIFYSSGKYKLTNILNEFKKDGIKKMMLSDNLKLEIITLRSYKLRSKKN